MAPGHRRAGLARSASADTTSRRRCRRGRRGCTSAAAKKPRSSATGSSARGRSRRLRCRCQHCIAKVFPLWAAPHKVAEEKAKELGCERDAVRARPQISTRCWPRSPGPAAGYPVGQDEQGRAIVTNLPATLPILFDAFCALNGAGRGGGRRRRAAHLRRARHAGRAARPALAGSGIAKGDRVAIAMRNCPAWIVGYMAVLKAGGVATLINGWWQAAGDAPRARPGRARADHRRRAARQADRGRLRQIATGRRCRSSSRSSEALAPLLARGGRGGPARDRARGRRDHPVHLGLDRPRQGRGLDPPRRHHRRLCLCDRPRVLLGIKERRGESRAAAQATLVNVPLFHVTGEVPVLLNSFVIGRTMVLMPKWDAGRGAAADREGEDHLFRRRADDEPRADATIPTATNTTSPR